MESNTGAAVWALAAVVGTSFAAVLHASRIPGCTESASQEPTDGATPAPKDASRRQQRSLRPHHAIPKQPVRSNATNSVAVEQARCSDRQQRHPAKHGRNMSGKHNMPPPQNAASPSLSSTTSLINSEQLQAAGQNHIGTDHNAATRAPVPPGSQLERPRMVPLRKTLPAVRDVAKLLGPFLELVSVEEVVNPYLAARWTEQKAYMADRQSGPNEKLLFHGSGATPPAVIALGRQGFDPRLSKGIFYGRGVYFAENPECEPDLPCPRESK